MSRKIQITKLTHIFLHSIALFAIIASITPLTAAGESSSDQERTVAALVNGHPIYLEQVEPMVEAKLKGYGKFGVRRIDDDLLYKLRLNALEQVVAGEALYQAARAADPEGVEEMVQKALEKAPHPRYEAHLTPEQRRASIERQAVIQAYLDDLGMLDPEIPEEEIRAYYEESKEGFTTPEKVQASHIVLEVPAEADRETEDEARERIREIRGRIVSGEQSFAEAARECSACASAPSGGDLGAIERGYMPQEFDAVAFTIAPGEVSAPIRTKHGWHLLKVAEKHPAGITPFKDMKDFLGKFLKQQRTKKLVAEHMQKLSRDAEVEILLEPPAESKAH